MPWAGAIQAGTTLIGGLLQHRAEGRAANAQEEAARRAEALQREMYGQASGNLQPYLGLGRSGANGLQALAGGDYSGLFDSPDYKASLAAGIQANDRSAAARGRLFSGGYGADLNSWAQDHAAGYLNNYRNGLMSLAQLGQGSALGLGQLGAGMAGQVGQYQLDAGNARASGYQNQAGTIAGTIGGLAGLAGNNWRSTTSAYQSPGGYNSSGWRWGSGTDTDFGIPMPGSGYMGGS